MAVVSIVYIGALAIMVMASVFWLSGINAQLTLIFDRLRFAGHTVSTGILDMFELSAHGREALQIHRQKVQAAIVVLSSIHSILTVGIWLMSCIIWQPGMAISKALPAHWFSWKIVSIKTIVILTCFWTMCPSTRISKSGMRSPTFRHGLIFFQQPDL